MQLGMQYLPDQFPPPASTGSWSRFLGIVHSWGDTVLCSRPRPRRTLWHRWDYWLFFCWFVFLNSVTSGLCCGTVHHLREKKIIHSWIWWQCHLQRYSPEHVWGHWSRILLSFFVFCYILCGPLCWFIPKVQVCFLSFIYVGSDLYLSIP